MFAAVPDASPILQLKTVHVEELLLPILIQLVAIIAAARIFGALARKAGQTSAVGEIIAGLLLGPSCFKLLAPQWFEMIFAPTMPSVADPLLARVAFDKIFVVLAQIGLIFLLFLIGLEFDFVHLKVEGRATLLISLAGIAIPFAIGAGIAPILYTATVTPNGAPVPYLGFLLFLGVAMSITAIPMLGRIMLELGIQRTRLGAVVIAAAALEDAIGWILLATIAAIVNLGTDQFRWQDTAIMLGSTVGFGLAMIFAVRPLLIRYFRWSLRANGGQLSLNALAVLMVALLLCSIATNLIGIFAIFGAFLLGACLSDQAELREAATAKLRDLITAFFLPIFFTITGLRTDIGSLSGLWWVACVVLLAAVVGKLGGCMLVAKLGGFGWKESWMIGAMMNTRGLMELIVINLGRDLGVVPPGLYSALVLMAIVTTMMTSPIVMLLRRGTELEEPIRLSGFANS